MRRNRQGDVVNELQRLREHDAVECILGQHVRVGEVADDRRARIALMHVQHVAARYM